MQYLKHSAIEALPKFDGGMQHRLTAALTAYQSRASVTVHAGYWVSGMHAANKCCRCGLILRWYCLYGCGLSRSGLSTEAGAGLCSIVKRASLFDYTAGS